MGIGMSGMLEDRGVKLLRSLHAIKEAWIISGNWHRGNGLHMSSSKKVCRSRVGLRACSILLQRISGDGPMLKLGKYGCSKVVPYLD